jgi:hypothetical protein
MNPPGHRLAFAICVCLCAVQWARAETARFYVVWGLKGGGYHGEITVENGEFLAVDPWRWEPADELHADDPHRVTWIGNVYNGCDGLEFSVRGSAETTFRLQFTAPHRADVTLGWDDVNRPPEHVVPLGKRFDFAAYGPGDIRRGPRITRYVEIPAVHQPPPPPDRGFVTLPNNWWQQATALEIELSQAPAGEIDPRRVAGPDGSLLIRLNEVPLAGSAEIHFAGQQLASLPLAGQLWLKCAPRVGSLEVVLAYPGGRSSLRVPTTLVEVREARLWVNGEPFLVKGTLPRDLNDEDAAYLKSLGANTLRMRPTDQVPLLARHGFMLIASCHTGPGRLCERAETEANFNRGVTTYLNNTMPLVHAIADHPHALILQVGNEQVMGQDPWLSRFKPPHSFERLDYLLTRLYNAVRSVETMLPIGYSNCAFGYIAPDFLDVYLHNTYLAKDRDWPPIEEFLRLQGCDQRPCIHTEFGANTYMPQLYLRGPNSPVLEKIHAWNYPQRWKNYLSAGVQGAINYCLYDYDYSKVNRGSWDKGFTNFGIMTFDRQPKLVCWELWHLWRDFTVTPSGPGRLQIDWKRDYAARQCRLRLRANDWERVIPLEDFTPHSKRSVDLPRDIPVFRWRIDYTTHQGLPMQACGACPQAVEEGEFLERLEHRATYPFLEELYDAQVITINGDVAPPTLREMEREDGVVPVAFRKRNGDVYVTAFTRKKPDVGWYHEQVTLDVGFPGNVTEVDELTGREIASSLVVQQTAEGVRISNLRVPYMPSQYGHRATEPITLPVLKITPYY